MVIIIMISFGNGDKIV